MQLSPSSINLRSSIIQGLKNASDTKAKNWYSNYIQNSQWIGCKVPTIRKVVHEQCRLASLHSSGGLSSAINPMDLLELSINLIQHVECDVKLAGIILLSEVYPLQKLITLNILDHITENIFTVPSTTPSPQYDELHINNWCTSDFFAHHVLRRIAYAPSNSNHNLSLRILHFAETGSTLWHRRCGIVTFVDYYKHLNQLPNNFGCLLIRAVESCLLASPRERFTQTGCAWVLRFSLLQHGDRDIAYNLIQKHSKLWTGEAKRSLVERLSRKDPWRKTILALR